MSLQHNWNFDKWNFCLPIETPQIYEQIWIFFKWVFIILFSKGCGSVDIHILVSSNR